MPLLEFGANRTALGEEASRVFVIRRKAVVGPPVEIAADLRIPLKELRDRHVGVGNLGALGKPFRFAHV